ncbi:MAG: beta-N-acetylglucosaminidase domain-containing protein [Rikenellaceae bacterium]|nr:beta-N-acetylglucosaminidase domain-containing protein [Rikenellaceae bacterium]
MKRIFLTMLMSLGVTTLIAQTGKVPVTGVGEADPYALAALEALLDTVDTDGIREVYIGERGDGSVSAWSGKIPAAADGFFVSVGDGRVVVAGSNGRGTLYGVDELARIMASHPASGAEVFETADSPRIASRGVVEGFYGRPWSHKARLDQLDYYRLCRMNTYIYGPKDDPYHSSPHWREPYPEQEAAQIAELADRARRNGVEFVWAIHPGKDIRWDDNDLDSLIGKFSQMYDLGVRSFAVFFDDISGDGTDPKKQAALLNTLTDRFVRVKGDVAPLIMCPTEYNKSWSDPKKGYLSTLGKRLDPSVRIMWTGDRVVSDITEDGLRWIEGQTGRPAYIWWNFPVSDYVRDHMLLGRVYGLTAEGTGMMSGFVTNPMEHAEASKIAIYGVGRYCWNPSTFDSRQAWEEALRILMPHDYAALRIFAEHNSDMGPTGHKYRREESVNVESVAAEALEAYRNGQTDRRTVELLERMSQEFRDIVAAADILLESADNEALTEELRPWLLRFKILGQEGVEVTGLAVEACGPKNAAPDADTAKWRHRADFARKHVSALKSMADRIDTTYNRNPYQPGVKCGTKVLQPFIDSLSSVVFGM